MKAQPPLKKNKGFALIATISVLLLLTLIAVAFLSLSAVSVQTSRIDFAEEEARSNARLALMIALGELQREMGPDQRVSANAAIFDDTEDTEDVSGVEQPNWLGVWSTNWAEISGNGSPSNPEDGTVWERKNDEGGLQDLRATNSYDPEDARRTYLVSGNEGGLAGMESSGRDFIDAVKDGVNGLDDSQKEHLIVGQGSVRNTDDEVRVPSVEILRASRTPNGSIQDRARGSYAYWISDESQKASVNVYDRRASEALDPQSGDGYERILYPQDYELSAITGLSSVSETSRNLLFSPAAVILASDMEADDYRDRYHDLTANTRSVMTNVRDGGLKKDLSLFILGTGDIDDEDSSRLEYVGVSRDDLLVGPPNATIANLMGLEYDAKFEGTAPRFGILPKWLEMAVKEDFSLVSQELDLTDNKELLPEEFNYGSVQTWDIYDNLLGESDWEGVKFTELDKTSYAPVVVESSLFYNVATYNIDGGLDETDPDNVDWKGYVVLYPRVALWNPYNVDLIVPPMLCQIFVNGNKHIEVTFEDGPSKNVRLEFGTGLGGGRGNLWFLLADSIDPDQAAEGFTIPAGQTLVFTPDLDASKRTRERPDLRGNYSRSDFLNNLLTTKATEGPDNYLLTEINFGEGNQEVKVKPVSFIEKPDPDQDLVDSGADNYQWMLKDASGVSIRVNTAAEVADMPLISYGNASLQAGGGDELPVEWDGSQNSAVEIYTFNGDVPANGLNKNGGTGEPDFRTRDGFRMRWYREHSSNTSGDGLSLDSEDSSKLFQTAGIGNWNIRASYSSRNPWDNITNAAPYFFGNYTRDNFDLAVSFDQTRPLEVDGNQTSFPFGPPNSEYNEGPIVLFELPAANIGIPSLGYLRHLKLSELSWHPTYAIGNSLADPRCEPEGTIPDLSALENQDKGGWNVSTIGTADNRNTSRGPTYWATLLRQIYFEEPTESHMVFDMSYETNFNLWDTYMIPTNASTLTSRGQQIANFAQDPSDNPLPDGRLGLFSRPDLTTDVESDLNDFFRAASRLSVEGGFNVHSTSVEAWKAFLSSSMDVTIRDSEKVIFPRHLNPAEATSDEGGITQETLAGNRQLSDNEVEQLAIMMVSEVKKRAPFFGMADFVNRRLTPSEDDIDLARAGAIESAIENSGINSGFETSDLLIQDRDTDLSDVSFDSITDATRLDHRLKPVSQAWGLPGYLTQGDVLSAVGSAMTTRGDTFKIRTYGESRDVNGKVLARAWCEATIQRTPEPVSPDELNGDPGINPEEVSGDQVDFGRRMRIVGFRWLSGDEV